MVSLFTFLIFHVILLITSVSTTNTEFKLPRIAVIDAQLEWKLIGNSIISPCSITSYPVQHNVRSPSSDLRLGWGCAVTASIDRNIFNAFQLHHYTTRQYFDDRLYFSFSLRLRHSNIDCRQSLDGVCADAEAIGLSIADLRGFKVRLFVADLFEEFHSIELMVSDGSEDGPWHSVETVFALKEFSVEDATIGIELIHEATSNTLPVPSASECHQLMNNSFLELHQCEKVYLASEDSHAHYTGIWINGRCVAKEHAVVMCKIAAHLSININEIQLSYLPQPKKLELFSGYNEQLRGRVTDQNSSSCSLLGSSHAVLLNKVQVAPAVADPPRVLCAIYTTASRHENKLHAVYTTWGKKCTGFIAISTQYDARYNAMELPHIGTESYYNIWQKIRSLWAYIYRHYINDFNWFLVAGDDTYYIMENLYDYLSSSEIRAAVKQQRGVFLGRTFILPSAARKEDDKTYPKVQPDHKFNSGGAGYVIDKIALKVLAMNLHYDHCEPTLATAWEDVCIAKCLLGANTPILPYNSTRDSLGKERFHPFPPGTHFTYRHDASATIEQDWFYYYDLQIKYGFDCCSSSSISFHYINPQLMFQIDNYLYECRLDEKESYYNYMGEHFYNHTILLYGSAAERSVATSALWKQNELIREEIVLDT